MRLLTPLLLAPVLLFCITIDFTQPCANLATAAEPDRAVGMADLPERSAGGGRFLYINRVPVLYVEGSPAEMGRQTAELLGGKVHALLDYPRQLMQGNNKAVGWEQMVACARGLWKNAPADHRKEMDAFVAASGLDRDTVLVGNQIMDIYRGMGCSSLIVEPTRSKTGGPVFGRNLDFYGAGILHKYSMVTVCRPQGKHAFASVGFAGLLGTLSGINDAGLAVAVHEVMVARDGSLLFNPQGVPYTFAFRRILEECTTVEEAEKLIRSVKLTTKLNLAVCDREKSAVLEITPKSVVRRDSKDGICVCTNHFCTPQLMIFPFCRRFAALEKAREMEKLGVDDVIAKMHAATSEHLTLQTMIFEPQTLRLHLSAGNIPSTKGPFRTIDLGAALTGGKMAAKKH